MLYFLMIPVFIGDIQQKVSGQFPVCLDFHFHLCNPRSRGIPRRFCVFHIEIIDSQSTPRLDIDIFPNAASVEFRTPVPAALILRLTGEHTVIRQFVGQLRRRFLVKRLCRQESHYQFIVRVFQMFGHLETPCAEHICRHLLPGSGL